MTLPADRLTGKPRGFAFVRMATEEDAHSVIEALDGRELDGRRLRINEAREPGRAPSGSEGLGGGSSSAAP